MFQLAEFAEVMRERGDTKVTDLLKKIQVRNVNKDGRKQIRERFIALSAISYPGKCMHMFAQYYPTLKHNHKMLNKLPESGVESSVEFVYKLRRRFFIF